MAEPKNRNAFMEMYGDAARIALFPMQLDKKISSSPLHWNTCFSLFFFFESLCGFGFGFFPNCSLKITNMKNPSCVGVWLKMEKFSGSVLNSDQEFCVGSQQTSVSSV